MNGIDDREMEERVRRTLHAVADLVVDDPPPRREASHAGRSRARARYESPRVHVDDVVVAPVAEPAPARIPAGRVLVAIGAAVGVAALIVAALVVATSSNDPTRVQSPAGRGGGNVATSPPVTTTSPAAVAGMVTVPNLVGMTEADARAALQAAGLNNGISTAVVSALPAGTVATQDQAAGARVATGTTVQLGVSRGS